MRRFDSLLAIPMSRRSGAGGPSQSSAGTDDLGESSAGTDDSVAGYESWLEQAAYIPHVPASARLPSPGQVVSKKYRIEAELGRGGMGAVYRARHVLSGKLVALKWMLRPVTGKRDARRIMREAQATARITHPNVVDVYDVGREGEASYLVMELLYGESLRERLRRGPLSVADAVTSVLPAMQGVAAAHQKGVVHRDLKPDNIFLCEPGEGAAQAKVLDFGVAALGRAQGDGQATLTNEGAIVGTPAYMSPEQLRDPRSADARSDVYAFGVVLYEAVTGRLPFEADAYSSLVLAVCRDDPTPPRAHRPSLPCAFEDVVLAALDKDPEHRTGSVPALIDALLPFTGGSATESTEAGEGRVAAVTEPAVSPAEPTPPWLRRTTRNRLALTAAVAVAACTAGAWSWRHVHAAKGTPASAATTPAGRLDPPSYTDSHFDLALAPAKPVPVLMGTQVDEAPPVAAAATGMFEHDRPQSEALDPPRGAAPTAASIATPPAGRAATRPPRPRRKIARPARSQAPATGPGRSGSIVFEDM
ncbi:MAG: protein kinase [Myxococcales bacterium]|nr:protein kinase [Myxococcales bacterium]